MRNSSWLGRAPMRAWLLAVALAAPSFFACGCTQNLFSEFADKTSDAALLYDARMQMNKRNWTDAIASFQKMTPTGLAQRATKLQYASAYAGRCGLDVIALAQIVSAGTGNLFPMLMIAFQGATASQVADCLQARVLLLSIESYASARTVDENVFAVFVAMADIGARLAAYGDASPVDGSVDASFDPCTTSPFGAPQAPPGTAADDSSRQIGVDFSVLVDSLSASGMPTLLGSAQAQLTALCTAMYAAFPTYAICGGTGALNLDATAWTQLQVSAIEGVIRTNSQPGLSIVNLPPIPQGAGGSFCM